MPSVPSRPAGEPSRNEPGQRDGPTHGHADRREFDLGRFTLVVTFLQSPYPGPVNQPVDDRAEQGHDHVGHEQRDAHGVTVPELMAKCGYRQRPIAFHSTA